MKKSIVSIISFMLVSIMFFSMTAMAAPATDANRYDANGNQIYGSGMYYDRNNNPMYGRNCYYYDNNGATVSASGCRAYSYNTDGNLVPAQYCYDANGNAVQPSNSADAYSGRGRGGCCGR